MFHSVSSSRLHASVSAGAVSFALLAAAAPAHAQQQCGPQHSGVVECDSSDAPFPTGIEYNVDGDLTLNLESGLTVAPVPFSSGIIVSSNSGSVVIHGGGADVSTADAGGIGAFAAGDLSIAIDDVETSGMGAWGITSFTFSGDTLIEADTITTNGDYGMAVVAESGTGNIQISATAIETTGLAADGVTVRTGGDISVEVGSIKGEGDYLWGVNAQNGNYVDGEIIVGNTVVDVGTIEITGDNAIGVYATGFGEVDVTVDSIQISGDYGNGVLAFGFEDVNVEVGDVTFEGDYTGGIVAFSYAEASVKVGTLTASNGGGVIAFGVEGAHAEAESIDVTGDFANGIQAVSMYGNATINVGEVSTNGFFSVAVNGDALQGDLVINAGKITTQGELAMGIRAFGETSTIHVSGPISTSGDLAFGILNATTHGDAIVRTAGPVSTSGNYATALWITGRYGTADIEADGKVMTAGDQADAIYAIGEDGQVKVVANEVQTSGDESHGIRARTRYVEYFLGMPADPDPVEFTGDIDIQADVVKVSGAGSMGITARGLGNATIDVGTVSAFDNYAIETNMIEDASITVRDAATSAQGSAIMAEAEDVSISVESGATVAGGVHGIVVKAMGDRCVMENPMDGGPNPCPNPGDEWSNPDPDIPAAEVPGTATITNAGTIMGGSGYAVKVEVGTLTLNNSGTISGGLLLADGDDLVNNSGTFDVTRNSDFGLGNDLFKNSGTVKFATATTPRSFSLLNLEELENSGTIDMRNGVAGDTLTLSGNYVGSGNALLGVNVDFATGKADKFIIGGAATGSTQVMLGLTSNNARLTSGSGLAVAEVGAGSTADAFTIAEGSKDIGFIHYGLTYDPSARQYLLQGVAGAGAYRQLTALEGAENAWHASADAWRANATAARDARWMGMDGDAAALLGRSRFWGQAHAGSTRRDVRATEAGAGGTQSIASDYRQHRTGAQLGYDFASSHSDSGGFRAGLTGGFAKSTLDSRAADEEIRFETMNIGAYAGLSSGTLFGNLLAKYDRHDVDMNAVTAGFSAETEGHTWGIEAEAGGSFGGGRFFVEPLASLAWSRTSLDQVEAVGQALDFEGSSGLRGKLGARFGGRNEVGNGNSILFYGWGKGVHDFGKDYALTLVSGSGREEIDADRGKTFGEGVLGLSFLTARGLEAFAEAQGELGGKRKGLGGRAGIRLGF